jgi:hypothetical protein
MEFEEILLEEIITIIKEAKDENFMQSDLKRLLNQRLQEYGDALEEDFTNMDNSEEVEAAYKEGYDDGWDDAREEIQELARNMRRHD